MVGMMQLICLIAPLVCILYEELNDPGYKVGGIGGNILAIIIGIYLIKSKVIILATLLKYLALLNAVILIYRLFRK